MERTARLSPRQLRIAPLSLLAEELTRLQRDDRVNARVEQLDAVEERSMTSTHENCLDLTAAANASASREFIPVSSDNRSAVPR